MQAPGQGPLSLGLLEVRPATRGVISPEAREVLQPRVMQVLATLALADGGVVSRNDLIAVWPRALSGEGAPEPALRGPVAHRSQARGTGPIAAFGAQAPS
jgi:hypothetical protein